MPAGQFPANGGQPQKPTKSATLYQGRFFTGYYTNRSPLRSGVAPWLTEHFYGASQDALINGLNTEISNRLTLCRRPGNPVYTNPTSGISSATFDDVLRFESFHLLSPTTEDIDVMVDTGNANGGTNGLFTGLDVSGPDAKTLVFQKASSAGQAFMESVGNTLFFGDGAEQRKWLDTITTWADLYAASDDGTAPMPAGQYPYYTTYIDDSNGNMQQLIATVLKNNAQDVTINSDGITVTFYVPHGTANSAAANYAGLVAGGGTTLIEAETGGGTPVTFFGFTTATQLNGTTAYVSTITPGSGSSPDQVVAILTQSEAALSSTTDTGYVVLLNGGSPTTGTVQPTWSTEVLVPAAVWPYPYTGNPSTSVLTIDGTALWICRSAPVADKQAVGIFNWGIKAPTGTLPAPSPNVGSGAWEPSTFYSLDAVAVATSANGGDLWQVSVAGKGGSGSEPFTSGHAVGYTVSDNNATWTLIQLAASLSWVKGTAYCPQNVDANGNPIPGTGQYLVQSASGTPCLFQLQPVTVPRLIQQAATPSNTNMAAGDYVDLWYYDGDGGSGLFRPFPATTGGASATASVNSLLFNVGSDPNTSPMLNFTLNEAGEVTGSTTPYAGATNHYSMIALFSIEITQEFMNATGGMCALTMVHDDGAVLACAQSNVAWAQTNTSNLNGQTTGALNTSWSAIGGNNLNAHGGPYIDTGVITFPSAGIYDFEIDYFNFESQQTLTVAFAGYTPAPTLGPYTITSCGNASSGSTVYTGSIYAGVQSPVGQWFNVQGFTGADTVNNGYFLCTAYADGAGSGTLTLSNPQGISASATAIATCKSVVSMGSQPTSATPAWPAWGVGNAPNYPYTVEKSLYPGNGFGPWQPTGGYLTWANHGPKVDFTWIKNETFTLPDIDWTSEEPVGGILDTNGNLEGPYRTGYSGATVPVWATTLNALTYDNPNLIWINLGPQTSVPNPNGLTAGTGWSYGVALVNTLDNTVSNMSQLSARTSPVSNASYIQLPPGYGLQSIPNIDPQADWVAIFRTTDGGATPLLVPGIGNSIYTVPLNEYLANGYKDTTQDAGLNAELEGPENGENTPPATGAINLVYHLGRIFYSIGNVVYWTTGPDAPIGNGLNGTAPANFTYAPALVKRLFPTSIGLLVFTISDVYLIPGQGTPSNPLQEAQPYLPGVGLLSYNALDNCGTIIGMFTTDGTFMQIDPGGGFIDAGQPIGDLFGLHDTSTLGKNWLPKEVYVAYYMNGEDQAWYVADGASGWYRMCSTPSPETGYSWSPFAQIAGGTSTDPTIQTVQNIEVQPGIKRLLTGPYDSGQVLARASLASPSFTDGDMPYVAFADVGSILLVNPGQVAGINFITTESVKIGTPLRLGVLLDEAEPYTSVPFEMIREWESDPTNQPQSRSILAQRFYMSDDPDVDALCRHMQVRFYWGLDEVQNEISDFTIYGSFYAEN
jgi:hypothetical protein